MGKLTNKKYTLLTRFNREGDCDEKCSKFTKIAYTRKKIKKILDAKLPIIQIFDNSRKILPDYITIGYVVGYKEISKDEKEFVYELTIVLTFDLDEYIKNTNIELVLNVLQKQYEYKSKLIKAIGFTMFDRGIEKFILDIKSIVGVPGYKSDINFFKKNTDITIFNKQKGNKHGI